MEVSSVSVASWMSAEGRTKPDNSMEVEEYFSQAVDFRNVSLLQHWNCPSLRDEPGATVLKAHDRFLERASVARLTNWKLIGIPNAIGIEFRFLANAEWGSQ